MCRQHEESVSRYIERTCQQHERKRGQFGKEILASDQEERQHEEEGGEPGSSKGPEYGSRTGPANEDKETAKA
ncbi:MAG: hypothetical protein AUI01_05530 [Ktedonobacter sp. 13_2_20CM_2_56_8]|nr:MAG: hypothetical protein AUI01_05530 [Ktedonobacter sp. 13_2_20CM_2_56_8]